MTMRSIAFAALCLSAAAPAAAQTVVALSESDARAYDTAFADIDAHNWRGVTAALSRVDDDSLAGIVRGRMLLSSSYRASWSEYTSWLNRYGDYGMADAVYDRAMASRRRQIGRASCRERV